MEEGFPFEKWRGVGQLGPSWGHRSCCICVDSHMPNFSSINKYHRPFLLAMDNYFKTNSQASRLSFSPDSRYLSALFCDTNMLYVWDRTDGDHLCREGITDATFDPQNGSLLKSSKRKGLERFDGTASVHVHAPPGNPPKGNNNAPHDHAWHIFPSVGYMLAIEAVVHEVDCGAGSDSHGQRSPLRPLSNGRAQIWDHPYKWFKGHVKDYTETLRNVRCIDFNGVGAIFLSADENSCGQNIKMSLRTLELEPNTQFRKLPFPEEKLKCSTDTIRLVRMASSADATIAANTHCIYLWRLDEGWKRGEYSKGEPLEMRIVDQGVEDSISDVQYLQEYIAVGLTSGTVRVLDANAESFSHQEVHRLERIIPGSNKRIDSPKLQCSGAGVIAIAAQDHIIVKDIKADIQSYRDRQKRPRVTSDISASGALYSKRPYGLPTELLEMIFAYSLPLDAMNQEIRHRLTGEQRERTRVHPLLLANKLCYEIALDLLERSEVLIRIDENLSGTFRADKKCRSLLQRTQNIRLESTERASCVRLSIVALVEVWKERSSLKMVILHTKLPHYLQQLPTPIAESFAREVFKPVQDFCDEHGVLVREVREQMQSLMAADYTETLRWAAKEGCMAVAQYVCSLGTVDIDVVDGRRRTPLLWAAERGHDCIVRLLCDNGADPNSHDKYGHTPLLAAVIREHEEVVRTLLNAPNVNPNAVTRESMTVLAYATKMERSRLVDLLLSNENVDPNPMEVSGRTPLLIAAAGRDTQILQRLLTDTRVDLTAESNGETALHIAVRGSIDIVELLLQSNGINVNAIDANLRTPLHHAALHNSCHSVSMLLERGNVDVNLRDENGRTALHLAVACKHEEVVRLLLDHDDVQLNVTDNCQRTEILCAAEEGLESTVALLLSVERIRVDMKDSGGWTAPHFAAKRGLRDAVNGLIHHNRVDINARTTRGRTALHLAAKHGYEELVAILLRDGNINPNIRDDDGFAAVNLAAKKGHRRVLTGFESYGHHD